MLAASPLKSVKNEREREMSMEEEREFGDENLLDAIDFDDLLLGDVLPHLDAIDHPFFAEFSASESETKLETENNSPNNEENGADSLPDPVQEPESEPVEKKEGDTSKKSPVHSKSQPGKKKAKVDWTPELHRRFVQAVEELGIDKAVPSRILEIMGINCLTRHNIASHLQKYRSHRKHVLAREAETASWNRRRQIYGAAAAQAEVNHWIPSTLGFPPATPMPHFRPLHVWGHPSVDQSVMYTWPKHVAPPPPPPHTWPAPPLADPSFWHPNHQYVPPPGTLFFLPPHAQIQPTRFPRPAATAIPAVAQKLPLPPSDVHPSKESLDAAIGDVLTKPWLPLPLGLKPPSMDVVMVELRRQGVSKVPPT